MKRTFWTTVGLLLVIVAWYLAADRTTPFTSNARVKAIITPITPQVSGTIVEINAGNGEIVEAGTVIARIDPRQFEIAKQSAEADLARATQDVGADSADVSSAQTRVTRAQTDLETERLQAARVFELEEKGLIAVAKADESRRRLADAESELEQAQADLESEEKALGSTGNDNPRIQAALAKLSDAELKLSWTALEAPSRGVLSDLDVATGNYAKAGQSLMTFVDASNVWVEAYMTENNLGKIKIGDPVDVVLDMHPGKVWRGEVASLSIASSDGTNAKPGDPTPIPRTAGWLRDPQRFALRIILPEHTSGDETDDIRFNMNGQADVIVYTGDSFFLNTVGRFYIKLVALFSYAY
ncbi:HlyD family secretion protein [Shimia marina]|uniref:Inner membrane protein YibH n=1 Tax=Shimia marina TaxID=321267 RepID=A0A0P1ELK8_9RHOB|nr:HlyD family secretion protein [Shimia marina]CUH51319.1 Inner membrane protein YibH [Shimia marina]SFD52177.1 Multidrug resistance efflux pump [Shimia marina]